MVIMNVLRAECEPEPSHEPPSQPKASLIHPLIRSRFLRPQMNVHILLITSFIIKPIPRIQLYQYSFQIGTRFERERW